MHHAHRSWPLALALAGLTGAAGSAGVYAIPPDLVRAVPADVAIAYFWQGGLAEDGVDGDRTGNWAARLAGGAQQVGLLSLLDPALRPWADGSAAAIVAGRFPFAIALFEARAAPREGEAPTDPTAGHQLSDLRAALILLTRKQNTDIERQIQHFLLAYTNHEFSTLTTDGDNPPTRFTLRDTRLPSWCEISWGPVGDYYVVSIGAGSFGRVTNTLSQHQSSLARDEWFARASSELNLHGAAVGLYLRPGTMIVDADAALRRKVEQVREALHLNDTDRGLWTLRSDDRAIEVDLFRAITMLEEQGTRRATSASERSFQNRDREGAEGRSPRSLTNASPYRNERRTLAGGRIPDGVPGKLIPSGAKRYTVIEWNAPAVLDAISRAYLMSRSPASQAKLRSFWRRVEHESGMSIRDDLFTHFGPHLVIHNDPPHALRLPLAWTYIITINGDASTLRTNTEKLLGYVQDQLGESATLRLRREIVTALPPHRSSGKTSTPPAPANNQTPLSSESPPDAVGQPDFSPDSKASSAQGESMTIWYLFAGLNGPALAVTDQYVVISYSPHALRANLSGMAKGADRGQPVVRPKPPSPNP